MTLDKIYISVRIIMNEQQDGRSEIQEFRMNITTQITTATMMKFYIQLK